jgi:hypothetical protein
MRNFDKFSYNKSVIPQDIKEKIDFFKQLEETFLKELTESEEAKKYLD